jgi:hypothetical protein
MPEILQVTQIPEWLGAAVIGGIIAAIGYMAKQILDWLSAVFKARNMRLSQLAELFSLLRALGVAYDIQCELRNRLDAKIEENHPGLEQSEEGYEAALSKAYPEFKAEELELHMIIRSITINTLWPVNQSLAKWLKDDTYFKGQWHNKGIRGKLARKLGDLEAHLLLWEAKYKVWIPDNPEHALVYLNDENRHGLGFPPGTDQVVETALKERWLFFF